MYFLGVFVLSWLWFWIGADKTRLRELFGVAVWSSFLGLLTDLIMVHYQLWTYSGLPAPLFTIPLMLDFGIYPVVTYLFVQSLPEQWSGIILRSVTWAAGAIIFEYMTLQTGTMEHHLWWNLGLSFLADNVIFWSIALVYRYYRPAYSKQYETTSQG